MEGIHKPATCNLAVTYLNQLRNLRIIMVKTREVIKFTIQGLSNSERVSLCFVLFCKKTGRNFGFVVCMQ